MNVQIEEQFERGIVLYDFENNSAINSLVERIHKHSLGLSKAKTLPLTQAEARVLVQSYYLAVMHLREEDENRRNRKRIRKAQIESHPKQGKDANSRAHAGMKAINESEHRTKAYDDKLLVASFEHMRATSEKWEAIQGWNGHFFIFEPKLPPNTPARDNEAIALLTKAFGFKSEETCRRRLSKAGVKRLSV